MKTIKIICTALAIGAFGLVTAHAQSQEVDDLNRIGIKGGLNVSNLHIDNTDAESMKEGYHFGVYSRLNLAGPVSIQPELMYSRKGAEVEFNRTDLDNIDYTLDYVDLPVLLRVDMGALNLHAGGYASYLVDAETKAEDRRGNTIETELDEGDFHSFDYGLSGGLGLEWRALDMGVRYNYGLRDVGFGGDRDPNNILKNGRNSVAQFYIGFGF